MLLNERQDMRTLLEIVLQDVAAYQAAAQESSDGAAPAASVCIVSIDTTQASADEADSGASQQSPPRSGAPGGEPPPQRSTAAAAAAGHLQAGPGNLPVPANQSGKRSQHGGYEVFVLIDTFHMRDIDCSMLTLAM